jgi:threonine/homoserine/homoserine lactone efflux protein
MYIVTRSAAQGPQAGLVSVAGIHLGTVVHVVAAMVGLSALVAASATAFTAVKLVGAGYLIWLGVASIRAARRGVVAEPGAAIERRALSRVFVDGAVLNVFNPKTAIFFLSFVPQFVDPDAPSPALAIATLGALFIALGLVTDSCYALAGGWVGGRLKRSPRLQRRKELLAGGTYLGLGAVAALSGHRAA